MGNSLYEKITQELHGPNGQSLMKAARRSLTDPNSPDPDLADLGKMIAVRDGEAAFKKMMAELQDDANSTPVSPTVQVQAGFEHSWQSTQSDSKPDQVAQPGIPIPSGSPSLPGLPPFPAPNNIDEQGDEFSDTPSKPYTPKGPGKSSL